MLRKAAMKISISVNLSTSRFKSFRFTSYPSCLVCNETTISFMHKWHRIVEK